MQLPGLLNDSSLPALMQVAEGRGSIDVFIEQRLINREIVEFSLPKAGAILIRGLKIETPAHFQNACETLYPDLRSYTGGDSPRTELANKVFTSTDYASEYEVLLHNELSYAGWSPDRVMFGCLKAAKSGGETHLADGRLIYQELDPEIRQRFNDKGITYWQHLRDENGAPGTGLSWQDTFETTSQSEVEEYLQKSAMDFEWTDLGIRTSASHSSSLQHPVTGEWCWHNQADQWHRQLPSVKDSVGVSEAIKNPTAGIETLGNHVTFADGNEIHVDDLLHIREISKECEVRFPWRNGDLLIIDNVMTMHGRKPFTGERQIVVAMA